MPRKVSILQGGDAIFGALASECSGCARWLLVFITSRIRDLLPLSNPPLIAASPSARSDHPTTDRDPPQPRSSPGGFFVAAENRKTIGDFAL